MVLIKSIHAHHERGVQPVDEKQFSPRVRSRLRTPGERPRPVFAETPPRKTIRAQNLPSKKIGRVGEIKLERDGEPDDVRQLRQDDVARHHSLASPRASRHKL